MTQNSKSTKSIQLYGAYHKQPHYWSCSTPLPVITWMNLKMSLIINLIFYSLCIFPVSPLKVRCCISVVLFQVVSCSGCLPKWTWIGNSKFYHLTPHHQKWKKLVYIYMLYYHYPGPFFKGFWNACNRVFPGWLLKFSLILAQILPKKLACPGGFVMKLGWLSRC